MHISYSLPTRQTPGIVIRHLRDIAGNIVDTIYDGDDEPEGGLVPSFGQFIDDYFAAHGMSDEDIRAIYVAYRMAVDFPQFRSHLMELGMAESIAFFYFPVF